MTEISGFASTTPAPADLLVEVDVSDHTMASTGTNKKATIAQVGYAITGWWDLVRDFGADPTGSASSSTALANACTAAVAAQPASFGLTVPPGQYLLIASQDLPYNMTVRAAGYAGGTVTGLRTGTWFNADSGFSGSYVFGFKDVPAPTTYTGVNGCNASGFGVYGGGQTGSAVNGLYFSGPTMATLEGIGTCQMTGWGYSASGEDSGAAEQFPFGQTWTRLQSDSCGSVSGGGFQLEGCEDSVFTGCYSIGNNNGPGFYITGCDNAKFVGCNSEWNSTYGFYVTGDWQWFNGGCEFTGCSTDANGQYGMYIDATWTTGGGAGTGPGIIQIGNCHFRRDGQVNTTQSAGFAMGATTLPVIMNGFSTMPSIGDGGAGSMAPAFGMYFSQSSYSQPVVISNGLSWGNTATYRTGTTNSSLPTVSAGFITNIAKAHGPNYSPTYGS
jgi:hypothetical protein